MGLLIFCSMEYVYADVFLGPLSESMLDLLVLEGGNSADGGLAYGFDEGLYIIDSDSD